MTKTDRRIFLQSAAAAPFFAGATRGANDRIAIAFIGLGAMGSGNLDFAMAQPGVQVAALCDVRRQALDRAVQTAAAKGHQPKAVRDFREILADRSIDAVCIAAPDHWHAYMAVEACKAGKDVWVEKPLCRVLAEGAKMVQAARKYNRVVQAGTMQRSGAHFQSAAEFMRAGKLGKITFARTFNYLRLKREGNGAPPDSEPPAGLDWDLWLGPAPWHAYNPVRAGHEFRRYWDYAGGMLTDWGAHWIDIVQMALDEAMPETIAASGGKFWVTDDRETPDTLQALYTYPGGVLASYECRAESMLSPSGRSAGMIIHGSQGMMYLDRSGYTVTREKGSKLEPLEVKSSNSSNLAHWANFLECMRTRQKPASDVEKCFRSTAACLLGNVAYRSGLTLHWNAKALTVREEAARAYLSCEYRKPWTLEV